MLAHTLQIIDRIASSERFGNYMVDINAVLAEASAAAHAFVPTMVAGIFAVFKIVASISHLFTSTDVFELLLLHKDERIHHHFSSIRKDLYHEVLSSL